MLYVNKNDLVEIAQIIRDNSNISTLLSLNDIEEYLRSNADKHHIVLEDLSEELQEIEENIDRTAITLDQLEDIIGSLRSGG